MATETGLDYGSLTYTQLDCLMRQGKPPRREAPSLADVRAWVER